MVPGDDGAVLERGLPGSLASGRFVDGEVGPAGWRSAFPERSFQC